MTPDESHRRPPRGLPPATIARAAGAAVPPPGTEPGDDGERLVLSELVSRVLDKGVLLHGSVTIAVADIDLIQLELDVLLYAVESAVRRTARRSDPDADVPVLPPAAGE